MTRSGMETNSNDGQISGNSNEGKKEEETGAQILTRNTIIPSLDTLDAGDVIECYTLMRMAPLENTKTLSSRLVGSDSSGSSNINIPIMKTAVAFRYKPKFTAKSEMLSKPKFELILEYGPQRTGPKQTNEAVPIVNGNSNHLDSKDGGSSMYLSWENHAKIYYSLSTKVDEWANAYYMAPITGAVLSKIFDYILEYPTNHPRYQPFTVMAKNKPDHHIIKSSNSDDFVWSVFNQLADWYVAIDPVLVPKRYGIILYVEDDKRDVERLGGLEIIDRDKDDGDKKWKGKRNRKAKLDGEEDNSKANANNGSGSGTDEDHPNETRVKVKKQTVAHAAAQFYEHLYDCIGSIKTGAYSNVERKPDPTAVPSASPSSSPTPDPTVNSNWPTVTPSEQQPANDGEEILDREPTASTSKVTEDTDVEIDKNDQDRAPHDTEKTNEGLVDDGDATAHKFKKKNKRHKDACKLPAHTGNCRASFERWFFNSTVARCETFTYGGCESNANNFETKRACKDRCVGSWNSDSSLVNGGDAGADFDRAKDAAGIGSIDVDSNNEDYSDEDDEGVMEVNLNDDEVGLSGINDDNYDGEVNLNNEGEGSGDTDVDSNIDNSHPNRGTVGLNDGTYDKHNKPKKRDHNSYNPNRREEIDNSLNTSIAYIDNNDSDDYIDDNTEDEDNTDDKTSLQGADDAKTAAEEAEITAEKAKEAAKSTEDGVATAAADLATEAAKKAVSATTEAAAHMAKVNLLSGDGAIATSILSTCFSNPKYEIRKDLSTSWNDTTSVTTTTHTYLYYDGAHYFRLNLTAPYITSNLMNSSLPSIQDPLSGKGEMIDFTLALTIILGFLFGILVMLHNSGIVHWDRRLRFRWFFQPNHHRNNRNTNGNRKDGKRVDHRSYEYEMQNMQCSYEEKTAETELEPHTNMENTWIFNSKSKEHNGKQYSSDITAESQNNTNNTSNNAKEISDVFACPVHTGRSCTSSSPLVVVDLSQQVQGLKPTFGEAEEKTSMEIIHKLTSARMMRDLKLDTSKCYINIDRDPDMVDFPDLEMRSKIAVPISIINPAHSQV